MAKRSSGKKGGSKPADASPNGGIVALTRELWQAAVTLRGSIEPADYKRYVLPIIFLRFLSLRYDRRRAELEKLIADSVLTAGAEAAWHESGTAVAMKLANHTLQAIMFQSL